MTTNQARKSVVAAPLFVLFACTIPLRADLIGISPTGQVVSINATTGAGTLIGASGVTGTLSLATNNIAGTMYTVDGADRLDRIDPLTGLATVGPFVTGLGAFTSLNGLAFSSTGVLFATANNGSTVDLFTINTTTGASTLIGAMSPTLTLDIAFSSLDTLYAWNASTTNGGLMTVNTTTGAGAFVTSGFSALFLTGMTFDATGSLLGVATSLYGINTSTSATTLIGSTGGFDIRGLALAPVPEPGSFILTLIGVALAGLIARRSNLPRP